MAAILTAMWSVIFHGSLLTFCLAQRSFDPSLSIDVSEEEASRIAPRVVYSGFFSFRFGRRLRVAGNRDSTSRSRKDGVANAAPTSSDSTMPVSQIDCTMRSGSSNRSRTTENLSGGEKASIRTSEANTYVVSEQPSPPKSDIGDTVFSEATPLSPSQVYFVTPFGKSAFDCTGKAASGRRPRCHTFDTARSAERRREGARRRPQSVQLRSS